MTGYGQTTHEDEHLRISAEVKTINAKHADVSLRLPRALSAYELTWRNQAIACLERGKISLTVSYERKEENLPTTHINVDRFKAYYQTLQGLAEAVDATTPSLFQLALQGPEVITPTDPAAGTEDARPLLEKVIQEALAQCDHSRQTEGTALASQILGSLQNIKESLAQVEKLAPARAQAASEKLRAGVAALVQEVDESRLAQELIYYLERLDITEEQVRLGQHLVYFEEVMHSAQSAGKKLGFIAQEMGREINTIGSKANDAAIQKEVVLMKDELEKIKEQLHNIL